MATVREGATSVLMVVDVQVGVVESAWERDRVVGNVARAVERARAQSVPVVWVQHGDDDLPRGSDAWQWVPELVPRADETIVHKKFNSAFEDTELERVLASLGATHIVLAGAATNWCIRATAYGALDRGYDLTLVKDAHTTESIDLGDGKALDAAHLVTDLNIAIRWLAYPGRANAIAAAEDVDYGRNQALPTTK
jgi:nicotinamidase-related amidase